MRVLSREGVRDGGIDQPVRDYLSRNLGRERINTSISIKHMLNSKEKKLATTHLSLRQEYMCPVSPSVTKSISAEEPGSINTS